MTEEWIVTKGVTEIFLVSADNLKAAEEAVDRGEAVMVQRRTSTNTHPKPDNAPTAEASGAQHPSTPKGKVE